MGFSINDSRLKVLSSFSYKEYNFFHLLLGLLLWCLFFGGVVLYKNL
uniref:Uncharacterized protein n=1 Tax=Pfiesteria piscicida TaxID=71001 RepID=E8Z663_PFIPI|nr:unknown [Pfiesteria piscicida]